MPSEMRERRRMRAEEKAHRLPVLLSIPLVACMLPVMIGVLMLPAVIRVMRAVDAGTGGEVEMRQGGEIAGRGGDAAGSPRARAANRASSRSGRRRRRLRQAREPVPFRIAEAQRPVRAGQCRAGARRLPQGAARGSGQRRRAGRASPPATTRWAASTCRGAIMNRRWRSLRAMLGSTPISPRRSICRAGARKPPQSAAEMAQRLAAAAVRPAEEAPVRALATVPLNEAVAAAPASPTVVAAPELRSPPAVSPATPAPVVKQALAIPRPTVAAHSVTVALAPPRPASPAAVAPVQAGPRLERLSLGEVALVTGPAPLWKAQVVDRTPRSATIGFRPLARPPVRTASVILLNAARSQGLAARTRALSQPARLEPDRDRRRAQGAPRKHHILPGEPARHRRQIGQPIRLRSAPSAVRDRGPDHHARPRRRGQRHFAGKKRMSLLIAAALAAVAPASEPSQLAAPAATPSLAEATHAIGAGRLEQAREMIAAAISAGASGEQVDRLLADFAFASGDNAGALAGYAKLFAAHPRQWFPRRARGDRFLEARGYGTRDCLSRPCHRQSLRLMAGMECARHRRRPRE